MRPERRKRHHYVPVFLQKHFCDADGMLWYGIRDIQEVKRVSPRDAFVEKELYTSYEEAHEGPNDITYKPDDKYEREFADLLESPATPAIEKLIAGVDEALLDMVEGEQRTVIIPPDLGYGSRGVPGVIPPNSFLVFELEFISK